MADTAVTLAGPVEVMDSNPEMDNVDNSNDTDNLGRPCKFETLVQPRLHEIYGWIKAGMTDYSISGNLGIHPISFIRYKQRYDILASLYARAAAERNRLVMNSMFRKANGEIVPTVKQKLDRFGNKVDLLEEVYIPADVNAADLYLRNNDPNYKQAKSDTGGNVIINNIQLPQLQQQLQQVQDEIKRLDTQLAVDLEPTE